ncbi:hypothetical protein [Paenarthrobacter nicotinovorans]|uniref:hypothetical protein n=1 Tax=Paenarthrobacter nicotinovorans TaxID=29320 RepID=UPI0024865656|nr:hypothetical protein [Paenarthrobacter nicotinovorans]MDI2019995.1 hypothetical protein [Paenarthrobacter nicotinovorans]
MRRMSEMHPTSNKEDVERPATPNVTWSKNASLQLLTNKLSAKAKAQLPRDELSRAKAFGVLAPDAPPLKNLLERAPASLRAWMDEILVRRESDAGINAYSIALGKNSRIIAIYPQLHKVQILMSFAHQQFMYTWSPWLSKKLTGETLGPHTLDKGTERIRKLVEEYTESIGSLEEYDVVTRALRALDVGHTALPDLPPEISHSLDHHAQTGALAGTAFVLAHEFAHHLLGHTKRGPQSQPAPALSFLQERRTRLAQLGYTAPDGHPTAHQQELDADALAFLLVFGEGTADEEGERLLDAAQGAFVALPSLALAAAVAAERTFLDNDNDDSHPPFATRLKAIADLAHVISVQLQIPQDSSQSPTAPRASPNDYFQQLYACQEFLLILLRKSELEITYNGAQTPNIEN